MTRTLKIILAVNLIVITALVWTYAHLMVSPGKLIPGHRDLESDCFACHTPFAGASSDRCLACHKLPDIGRRTTLGAPVSKPLAGTPFHQGLVKQDCLACHSDHAGVRRYRIEGRFQHALLQPDVRQDCLACHRKPGDSLHREITDNCSRCHSQERWRPATFDHDRLFVLDRDHNAKCATCHTGNDYTRYTCYGCHEHSPEKIRSEHIEEGIRDYRNCVECHRSGDEHDIRMPGRRGESEGRRHGEDDDD